MKKVVLLFSIFLLFTGYTPYTELNDLAIVDMIGLEKQGNNYVLYLTTILPEKKENSTTNKHQVTKFTGRSLGEVFLKAKKCRSKTTYYGHLKLLLIHSNLLEEDSFDYFKKEFTQMNYLALTTDSSINDILELYPSSNQMNKFIKEKKQETAVISPVSFGEFLANLKDTEINAFLPLVNLKKDHLIVSGIRVLKNNVVLSSDLSKIHYLLTKKVTSFHTHYRNYEIEYTKVKPTFLCDKKKISIKIEANIASSDASLQELKSLKKGLEEQLAKQVYEFYKQEGQEGIDTTHLTNVIYRKNRDKKRAKEVYQEGKMQVKVTLGVDQNDKK